MIALPAAAFQDGAKLFGAFCAQCHGQGGAGGSATDLTAPLARASNRNELAVVIVGGIDGTEMPPAPGLSAAELTALLQYVESLRKVEPPSAGNKFRGEAAFRELKCGGCHIVNGVGGVLGPDLSEIGIRRSAEHLRRAITAPEPAAPGFKQVRVRTKAGRDVTGELLGDDTFSVRIREYNGRLRAFNRADLSAVIVDEGKSPMPAYADKLGEPELNGMIAYLLSLRGRL